MILLDFFNYQGFLPYYWILFAAEAVFLSSYHYFVMQPTDQFVAIIARTKPPPLGQVDLSIAKSRAAQYVVDLA